MRHLVFLFLVSGCGILSGLDTLRVDDSGAPDDMTVEDVAQSDANGRDVTQGDGASGDGATLDAPDSADAIVHDATAPPPDGPPVVCFINSQCSPTEYCAVPDGFCEAKGTCTVRPGPCPLAGVSVCGCDNKPYANSCLAHQAGQNVAYVGACE